MDFNYIRPNSLKSARHMLPKDWHKTQFLAGGTDLLGLIKDSVEQPEQVIDLKQIDELEAGVTRQSGKITLGALTKVAEIAANPMVLKHFPVVAQAAQSVASPQLRNVGTLGGNLCQRPRCWYFRGRFDCLRKGGDTCFAVGGENKYHAVIGGGPCYIVHPSDLAVALIAAGAEIELVHNGTKRRLLLQDFFVLPEENVLRENRLEPGELLSSVLLPVPAAQSKSLYLKARARSSWDFATVSVAVQAVLEQNKFRELRIVLGGVAPVPWPLSKTARACIGRRADDPAIAKIISAVLEEADPMEQNAYKIILARNLVKQALEKTGNVA